MPGFQSVTSEYLNDLRALDHMNSPKAKENKQYSDPYEPKTKGFPLEDMRAEKEITRADQKQESTLNQTKDEDSRKDPEEEYFRLAVLALKVLYNEKDNDFVFEVSPGKLYKKAKRNKIPFHQYYPWIEEQLKLCNEKLNPEKHREQHRGFLSKISHAIYNLRSVPTTDTTGRASITPGRDSKISQK